MYSKRMNNTSELPKRDGASSRAIARITGAASVVERLGRRTAPTILRWMLGLTLLSAVADRFGGWGAHGNPNVSWGDWAHFVAYTAEVNGFLPARLAPTLAVLATAAEAVLGIALLFGWFPRAVAWASTGLFVAFAAAMSLSFGVKAPLNYSVFVDAAAALLLGVWPPRATDSQPKSPIL